MTVKPTASLATGFAGLLRHVSNIDQIIENAVRAADAHAASRQTSLKTKPASRDAERGSQGGAVRWVWGGLGVVTLLWWLAGTTTPSTSVSHPAQASPEPVTTTTTTRLPAAPPASVALSELRLRVEQKPPIGTEHVHGAGELRYCFSEDIRLEAARDVPDSNAAIKRFNQMVDDFNARCGQYRYVEAERDRVFREVQANEPSLRDDGIARFRR